MPRKFSAQVAAFNQKYQRVLRAVARESVQETVSMAQQTVGEGGRMRVDTGFLRASIQAGLGKMPSGPSTNENDAVYPAGTIVAGEPVAATLLKWHPNLGTELFVGWTANYARYRETQDGFLKGATEMWTSVVEKHARRAQKALG